MPETPIKKCSQGHENDLDAIFCGSCGEKFKETTRCKCGTTNTVGEKFCGGCGEKLSGARVLCKYCGSTIDSGAVFCGECGKSTEEKTASSPDDSKHGMRWVRDRDDFAKRVDVEKLRGAFQTGIVVEEGTKALLLQNGALVASLEPGFYEMKTFTEALKESLVKAGGAVVKSGAAVVRGVKGFATGLFNKEIADTRVRTNEAIDKAVESMLAQDCTVLLVDAGDVEIKLNLSNVYTSDPFGIDISCNAVLRMQEPRLFFVNVMKSQVLFRVSELKDSLSLEMQNAFNEVIGKKSVVDLNSDLSLKQEFENIVKEHMNRTLGQSYGLNFFQLRTISYSFKHFNQIRGIHEEVFFQVSKDEAALQGRKRLFDVFDKTQLQEIAEQTKQTEHYRKLSATKIDQKRAENEEALGFKGVESDKEVEEKKIYADTRRRLREHILDAGKTDEDIARFLGEIKKGNLLREQEIKEFELLLQEKDADHKINREFLLKKLQLEQDFDFARLGITGEGDLKKLELGQEIDFEKLRLTAKAGIDYELTELEEKKKRMIFDSEISQARIQRAEVRDAYLNEEMAKLQVEQNKDLADLKTAEIAQEQMLNMKRKKAEIELNEERQREMLKLEAEERRLEIEIKRDRTKHDQDMEKTRLEKDHELKKIAALSDLSAEALISVSGPEQARMLTELKQTEAMKDYSEEKILAMAAAKSPEVAKAFQEKYKGLPKEETEKLYKMVIEAKDKALADKDKTSAEKDKFVADAMERIERLATNALHAQMGATSGVAAGFGMANAPHVVYPPQGQPGYYAGPTPGQPGFVNVNQTNQAGEGSGQKDQPESRVCVNPECQAIIPINKKFCPQCGKEQPNA